MMNCISSRFIVWIRLLQVFRRAQLVLTMVLVDDTQQLCNHSLLIVGRKNWSLALSLTSSKPTEPFVDSATFKEIVEKRKSPVGVAIVVVNSKKGTEVFNTKVTDKKQKILLYHFVTEHMLNDRSSFSATLHTMITVTSRTQMSVFQVLAKALVQSLMMLANQLSFIMLSMSLLSLQASVEYPKLILIMLTHKCLSSWPRVQQKSQVMGIFQSMAQTSSTLLL
jgi:multidrug transporter EmrE-like cation transporter